MKLERDTLKEIIRESLKELQAPAPATGSGGKEKPAGLQQVMAKGSGATTVNTMLKKLNGVPALTNLLAPMVGKVEALVAVAAVGTMLNVNVYEQAAKIKTYQANQDVKPGEAPKE